MTAIATDSTSSLAPSSRPRILLAEDDPNSRWALCALLRRFGFECRTAVDGNEALHLVASFRPRAILMDVMLPSLNGLEATRRLKADPSTREIPILIMTGNLTESNVHAAYRAGCDEFIPKPILWPNFLERLRTHLEEAGDPRISIKAARGFFESHPGSYQSQQ